MSADGFLTSNDLETQAVQVSYEHLSSQTTTRINHLSQRNYLPQTTSTRSIYYDGPSQLQAAVASNVHGGGFDSISSLVVIHTPKQQYQSKEDQLTVDGFDEGVKNQFRSKQIEGTHKNWVHEYKPINEISFQPDNPIEEIYYPLNQLQLHVEANQEDGISALYDYSLDNYLLQPNSCNISTEQSMIGNTLYQHMIPHTMQENLKKLKTKVAVLPSSQKLKDFLNIRYKQKSPHPQKILSTDNGQMFASNSFSSSIQEELTSQPSDSEIIEQASEIAGEMMSLNDESQQNNTQVEEAEMFQHQACLIRESARFMQELAQSQERNQKDKYVYESVLSPINPPTMNGVASNTDFEIQNKNMPKENDLIYYESPKKELNSQLMSMLMTSSPDHQNIGLNMQQELGEKFSKAVCRYIKQQVNNALLRYNRISIPQKKAQSPLRRSKAAGLTDLTFDTFIVTRGQQQLTSPQMKLSYSEEGRYQINNQIVENAVGVQNQENSIEDEIIREISTSLVNKMDGLRSLFNEVRDQFAVINGSSRKISIEQSHMGLQQQPSCYLQRCESGLSNSNSNSIQQMVNASDLDRWVKQADEYRDLYMKSEMELQAQSERYELIIADLKHQIMEKSHSKSDRFNTILQNGSFSDPIQGEENQCVNFLGQIVDAINQEMDFNELQFSLNSQVTDPYLQSQWRILLSELNKLRSLELQFYCQPSSRTQFATQSYQNTVSKPRKLIQRLDFMVDSNNFPLIDKLSQGTTPTVVAQEYKEHKIRHLEHELRILQEEKETQELEIRHLKLVNTSMHQSHSQRSGISAEGHRSQNNIGQQFFT